MSAKHLRPIHRHLLVVSVLAAAVFEAMAQAPIEEATGVRTPIQAPSRMDAGPATNSPPTPSEIRDMRRRYGDPSQRRQDYSKATGGRRMTTAPAWGNQQPPAADLELHELGQRIYLEGRRPDGSWVRGLRYGHIQAAGHAVACVMCHRRSGLGAIEGTLQVPPISGRYLYGQDARALVSMNLRSRKSFNQKHDPYTTESFTAALRGGIGINGAEMSPVMPRFDLSDKDIAGLETYLRHLSASWSPGVTANQIRFATVITPDVDPQRRKVFLETIKATINQKNGSFTPGQRLMSSAAEMVLQTQRFWELEVWELTGPASTWNAQLRKLQAEKPVFALVSGLGESEWKPIHEFCEREGIPGWFPSLKQAPEEAEDGFYSVYFSRGTALESEALLTVWRQQEAAARPHRVVQLVAPTSTGRVAALGLATLLKNEGIESTQLDLSKKNLSRVGETLMRLSPGDEVMVWAGAEQLNLLSEMARPMVPVYFSATMAGGEKAPYPLGWKSDLRLLYPYEMPEKRKSGLSYFKLWLQTRKIDLVDEVMQSEVFFAMDYLNDTVTEMLDNLHRDYLLERAENMLSLREGARAEEQARDLLTARQQAVHSGEALRETPYNNRSPRPLPHKELGGSTGRRESTTIYPHLSLAQQQRLASKGVFVVKFKTPQGQDVEPVGDWIVP